MSEHPIIFSGEIVRAILDGRKTMTRRVIKPQPEEYHGVGKFQGIDFWGYVRGMKLEEDSIHSKWPKCLLKYCPYGQTGDRLWVREAAYISPVDFGGPYTHYDSNENGRVVAYRANGRNEAAEDFGVKVTPSIFMPRWASRITLEIVNVKVERLQEISIEDCWKEGMSPDAPLNNYGSGAIERDAYAALWDSLNAKRGYPWNKNPWVWVIKFRREP